MSKDAVVFLGKFRPHLFDPIAREAQLRGLKCLFLTSKLPQDGRPYHSVVVPRDWHESSLRIYLDRWKQEFRIVGILSRDFGLDVEGTPAISAAHFALELGLPAANPDSLLASANKFVTRSMLREFGVATVDFDLCQTLAEAEAAAERIGYPVILKPMGGVSSSLIVRCNSVQELRNRFEDTLQRLQTIFYSKMCQLAHDFAVGYVGMRHFEPKSTLLIERYIGGREASVECIATENEIRAVLVHDKVRVTEKDRTVLEDILVIPPRRFSSDEVDAMERYAENCLRAIGFRNGIAHVELRYCPDTGPQLLEINPRIGGAYIADSWRQVAGINPDIALLSLALGTWKMPKERPVLPEGTVFGGLAYFSPRSGQLVAITGVDAARETKGVLNLNVHFHPPEAIGGDMEECFLATAWTRASSHEEIDALYEDLKEKMHFEVVDA